MPLLRVQVRNEYSLGAVELYRDVNKADPKELLEGVAVAGLVGVLRQLGDLAEFAAEVFHGLQEDVALTSSRSRKLVARVQRIEAAVSPLEKAILAQRSHLHFAYTSGSNWHTRIHCQENHFVYGDVPQFIMDSYEGCCSTPRLDLLDKFDPGGPGSCLKRYSDPTFFKRASVVSGDAHIEKIPKYKNRKIKKRRSWPRSGRLSRDASFSYHSGRTQFTQLNIGMRTFPSQTMSTYDATQTSDLGEQSNLYSRNGSDYIEADSRPSYSMQPEELESRESITSPLKRHDNDFLDYTLFEEKITDAYDDIHISPSQEQAGCSSSSVTWDEKMETLEPTAQCNHGEVSDKNYKDEKAIVRESASYYVHDGMTEEDDIDANLKTSLNLNVECKAVSSDTNDDACLHPSNKVVPTSTSDDAKIDEIESETDHFMDALNIIESESETDADSMKKEVNHSPMLHSPMLHSPMKKDVSVELQDHMENNVECQSPISPVVNNSPVNAYSEYDRNSLTERSSNVAISSISGSAKDEFKSMSSVDEILQITETVCESSNMLSLQQDVNSHENGCIAADTNVSHENGDINTGTNVSHGNVNPKDDRTNAESVSGTKLSSNYEGTSSGLPALDKPKANPELAKSASQTSNVSSFSFWTNGGLLGLQPSKPPDFSLLNSHPNNGESSSSDQHGDKSTMNTDPEAKLKNIEEGHDRESYTCPEHQKSGASFRKPSWKISPSDLDIKFGNLGASLYANNTSMAESVTASGNFLSSNSNSKAAIKASESLNSSSRIYEIGNKFLTSASNKKPLPGADVNSIPSGHSNSQKSHQNFQSHAFTGRNKIQFPGESPILSPSSSPPLEHMKISFQPIGGLETSKLKLKFPDGNIDYNGNVQDSFPSFQLVPEVYIAPHNLGSDSDDDTFYRSSPSLSDDHHSFRSESNSEQWESGESSTTKDHELYDSLRQLSPSEPVSTPSKNKTTSLEGFHETHVLQFSSFMNAQQNSESRRSLELQNLNTLNHSFREEFRISSKSEDTQFGHALSPPPPLPPNQWRDVNSSIDVSENKYTRMTEDSSYSFDQKISVSKISQQPKPAPLNQIQIDEVVNMQKSKKSNLQLSNGQRETNQADEKDFLHQIRTKSFNLRPTVASKPAVPSNGSANVQVTDILKRANAIRQAVGSDDGDEDSNWSDA